MSALIDLVYAVLILRATFRAIFVNGVKYTVSKANQFSPGVAKYYQSLDLTPNAVARGCSLPSEVTTSFELRC